ncbi:hypothetical protein P280DRAFT_472297 [Massarina eburnea CBS 473.64]|uniref:Uncharacterized protein n=1 Tax=Massarina eburnea CBS 473.64 TaxID=1395130 RepID=A0A6A6RQY0_9PLEO|nr:hypothetical protein P280DRAFT_472297 [Massarina eburnea CBS 473.64]
MCVSCEQLLDFATRLNYAFRGMFRISDSCRVRRGLEVVSREVPGFSLCSIAGAYRALCMYLVCRLYLGTSVFLEKSWA